MKCSHCGHENTEDSRFCAACGKPLTEPESPVSSETEQTEQPPELPKQKPGPTRKTWIWVLGIFLVLVLIGFVIFQFTGSERSSDADVNITDMVFSKTSTVFVRLEDDKVKADAKPLEVYVFQDDSVTVWEDPDTTLEKLLNMGSTAILDRVPDACDSEVTGVLTTGKSLDLYARGEILVALKNQSVTETVNGTNLAGFQIDGAREVFLTKADALTMLDPQTAVPVITDPSQEKLTGYIQEHAQTTCKSGQTVKEEPEKTEDEKEDWDKQTSDEKDTEEKDSEEKETADPDKTDTDKEEAETAVDGFEPGKYKAAYVMKIRKAPDLTSEQVGRVEEDQVVTIRKVSQDKEDDSIWGEIADGQWVCLKDKDYTYMKAEKA